VPWFLFPAESANKNEARLVASASPPPSRAHSLFLSLFLSLSLPVAVPQSDPLIHLSADLHDLLSCFPFWVSLGTGHHHNNVFSRARGIQSAIESTSPKRRHDFLLLSRIRLRCYGNRELSRTERNDNSTILLFASRSSTVFNPSPFCTFVHTLHSYRSLLAMILRT